jgi:hypothetical protein
MIRIASALDGRFALAPALAGAGVGHNEHTVTQQGLDPRPLVGGRDAGAQVPSWFMARGLVSP